jgi:hypothetical protein
MLKMPLFGKSTKNPSELVKALKEAVNSLERGDGKKAEKAQEDVSKNLVSFSFFFFCLMFTLLLANLDLCFTRFLDPQREKYLHH